MRNMNSLLFCVSFKNVFIAFVYFSSWCFLLLRFVSLMIKPSRCFKASFYIPENTLNFPATRGFRMKISMKLVHQYMIIFFNFSPTSNHLHPLQVENCNSNSRLVVDEDDNVKSGLKGSNITDYHTFNCRTEPTRASHEI